MTGDAAADRGGDRAPERDAAVAVPLQNLALHNAPLARELESAALRVLGSGRYIMPAPAPPTPSGAPGAQQISAVSQVSQVSEVHAFEDEAAVAFGVAHAVGVSSGTDALLAMLMAAGVGPGDEVVTTPFSFFATAGAISRVGARPIFADIEEGTFNLDPETALAALGARTRAVLTVHLFGRVARSSELRAACAARGIPLLEDAAQAAGATDEAGGRPGAIGTAAALSFFPSKNLGGFGDAGMVLTNDAAFAAAVRLLRTHGARAKFHHEAIGGNFRLDELQAALLRVKLPHLPGWTAARRAFAARYRRDLAGTALALPPPDPGCVWNQFVVRVPDGRRDELAAHLARKGIATAVYYPEPLHVQPCFATTARQAWGQFPVAERAAREVLALPLFPELTAAQLDHVVRAIRDHDLVSVA